MLSRRTRLGAAMLAVVYFCAIALFVIGGGHARLVAGLCLISSSISTWFLVLRIKAERTRK